MINVPICAAAILLAHTSGLLAQGYPPAMPAAAMPADQPISAVPGRLSMPRFARGWRSP